MAAGRPKGKKKEKRDVAKGMVFIRSSFNNTIITITDVEGGAVAWASAGTVGFKGTKKGTPFAAQLAAQACGRKAQDAGMRRIDIYVRGPGSGRETAIRSLQSLGFEIGVIRDQTPLPHNGCRPKKRRRV
ncbi:MAG: 30S ribosomal protein S11 [Armatimonadetes bacterium CG2_30_59_28]|nr:30S ribosomal protein S11 [Armatimonadota bacterium]OIO92509.1 MAG: 30S ribosomal protein S11 [Armatimonadetes bacterium CG2_30_59_28]PIU65742.1 MAG: 30S ribosomal protein S11 [Armatimonadetes bacterium CG07_land_8_20_14_0_80_59_28]PIX38247.1 MAG: 30S ribosomal protein S11 [Armatimonadetes bacterium CG_4_8_14_3_um_filter_58_9]PIY45113.1 MAG: 30S ribosomal protein S11 [Armatimonadetes bacterium CG_4_10_14_3_um_filter_59_10]